MANSRFIFAAYAVALAMGIPRAGAQQPAQGFAVERFYPSAPGAGWFVMDDLNMDGKLGGAVSLTGGYSRNAFEPVVSNEAFVDVGIAATHDGYRAYFNFPVPLVVNGTAATVNLAANPDTISDPRVGFDMRILGKPGSAFRLGAGAQLLFPSGSSADYVTDGTFREMFRLLAAGDSGRYSWAGQIGLQNRPVSDVQVPDGPNGNEVLFGLAAGRRLRAGKGWDAVIGPEFFGESAVHSSLNGQTGFEGLLTGRLEGTGDGRHLRIKLGIGHGLVQNFGAPEWRILCGVELFGLK